MEHIFFQVGNKVRVTSYSPFRGLSGTVRKVDADTISGLVEPFCFYLVDLEGAHIKEPVWFNYEEVDSVSPRDGDREDGLKHLEYFTSPTAE